MNRMDALTAKRRAAREVQASAAAEQIVKVAADRGIAVEVIGSLARGDFRAHSDVDLLVRAPIDPHRRHAVERLVADAMRPSGIAYDLIFEDDLEQDRLQEFLRDVV